MPVVMFIDFVVSWPNCFINKIVNFFWLERCLFFTCPLSLSSFPLFELQQSFLWAGAVHIHCDLEMLINLVMGKLESDFVWMGNHICTCDWSKWYSSLLWIRPTRFDDRARSLWRTRRGIPLNVSKIMSIGNHSEHDRNVNEFWSSSLTHSISR